MKYLLALNLSEQWQHIQADLFKRLEQSFAQSQVNTQVLEGIDQQNWPVIHTIQFLTSQPLKWKNHIFLCRKYQ